MSPARSASVTLKMDSQIIAEAPSSSVSENAFRSDIGHCVDRERDFRLFGGVFAKTSFGVRR